MKISDAIKTAAEELGIPYEVAHKAYYMAWEFIQNKMRELPLKEDLTDEEFNALRPNFNIPELGKFAVSLDKYKRVKRRIEYVKNLKNLMNDDTENKGNQTTV